MKAMIELIKELSENIFDEVVNHYRHFHQNPELSYQEINTSSYVQKILTDLGIEYKSGIGGNGVLGQLFCFFGRGLVHQVFW